MLLQSRGPCPCGHLRFTPIYNIQLLCVHMLGSQSTVLFGTSVDIFQLCGVIVILLKCSAEDVNDENF